MNDEMKTFILLKYSIINENEESWKSSSTYPKEVLKEWAWRCALDTIPLITDNNALETIRLIKLYRAGKCSREDVDIAYSMSGFQDMAFYSAIFHFPSVHMVFYKILTEWNIGLRNQKCKKYIGWLIEELYKYENNKNSN